MKNPLFLMFFLLFAACDTPPPDADRKPDALFRTTQPSRLYFKNMRAYYYRHEVQQNTKTDLYTMRKLTQTGDQPALLPIIADNWLQDEAYIFFKQTPNADIAEPLQLKWEDKSSGTHETFMLESRNTKQQYALARWMYKHLNEGHKFYYLNTANDWTTMREKPEIRTNFLKTLQDYYALTEKTSKSD